MKRRDFNKTLFVYPFIGGLPIAFGKDKPLIMADKVCQYINNVKIAEIKKLGILPDGDYYNFNKLHNVYYNQKTGSFYIKAWDSYIQPVEYSVSVDWLNKYEQSQRWDVAIRAIEIAQQGLKWKIQDSLLKVLIHSAEDSNHIRHWPLVSHVYTETGTTICRYKDETNLKFHGNTLEIPDMNQYQEYFKQQISSEYDFNHMYIHCSDKSDIRMFCYHWKAAPFQNKERTGFTFSAQVATACNIIHGKPPSVVLV